MLRPSIYLFVQNPPIFFIRKHMIGALESEHKLCHGSRTEILARFQFGYSVNSISLEMYASTHVQLKILEYTPLNIALSEDKTIIGTRPRIPDLFDHIIIHR